MSRKLYQARVEDGKVVFHEHDSSENWGAISINPLTGKTRHDAIIRLKEWLLDASEFARREAIEANAELSQHRASIRALEAWREEE